MESAIERDDDKGQDKKASAPLATAAGDGMLLPTDVQREILLRLPAGEVCLLRLVCRSWRSLTSDPGFADAHARRHPLVAGLDCTTRRALHILDAMSGNILRRIPVPRRGVSLTTARPDLVCVSPFHGPSFTLNPATGAVTAMPKNVGCAVESPYLLGLVPATGEHKVLRFNLELESRNRVTVQHCRVDVVTLGTDRRWRAAPRPAVHVEWRRPGDRVVVGGVAYFLLRLSLPNSAGIDPDTVAAFDLATEEWRPAMAGPTNGSKLKYHKHRCWFRLAKLDGCLVVVHHHCEYCSMDLWFLVDSGQGLWAKKHSIQCQSRCWRQHSCDPPHPLAVLHDGRIVFRVDRGVIRVYDPSTSLWADLVRLGEHYSDISIHEGSLLLCSCLQPVKPDPFR